MMKDMAAQAFAAWLQQNEPELFAALLERADRTGVAGLGAWTDVLSSIGSGLANAVKSVASYVASPSGTSSLTSLAQTYLQSQGQKNALKVQLAQAQAGYTPAPIETRYDAATNTYVPVYTPPAGTAPVPLTADLSAQLLRQSQRFDWNRWLPWIIGGGAGVAFVIWLATRNRP